MTEKPWLLLWICQNSFDAALIKFKLEEIDIPVVVFNQIDSSYGAFGTIRIMVPESDYPAAVGLLNSLGFER